MESWSSFIEKTLKLIRLFLIVICKKPIVIKSKKKKVTDAHSKIFIMSFLSMQFLNGINLDGYIWTLECS